MWKETGGKKSLFQGRKSTETGEKGQIADTIDKKLEKSVFKMFRLKKKKDVQITKGRHGGGP